jgi:ATP-dependent Lon protease
LVGGVWCISDLEYVFTEDKNSCPWIQNSLKPIQLSHFDFEGYLSAREQLTTDEWIDLLIQSVGFNPEMLGRRSKLLQLARLIPFCERNYNLIELGPKGTGKSHIYSEFSPHGILISGGEVTVPKLFVNNSNGKIGLVGYWDVVAFDEFAGKQKKVDKALVDILKNYLANKTFSRGIEMLGAEASMVFVGNTKHTLPYMLKHTNLFDELPEKYYDSAFLDRLHFYLPGWEVDIIRGEMFSSGYGFVVDYLAEILRSMRNHDFTQNYSEHFTLSTDISTRDRDGIHKTFSGMMKILYPKGEATLAEIEEILKFAIEGRKRVKDQLMRIDDTYAPVRFEYEDSAGKKTYVKTLEEKEYPRYCNSSQSEEDEDPVAEEEGTNPLGNDDSAIDNESVLREGNYTYEENQRGVCFDTLLGPYLKDATKITITDPYIRAFFQARNLMELLETIAKLKPDEDEMSVHLITIEDEFNTYKQIENFEKMRDSSTVVGINFSWEFDAKTTIHARHIITDHGWKILLDRGLDIFQQYEMNDAFAISNRLQQYRPCEAFEVTYLKL